MIFKTANAVRSIIHRPIGQTRKVTTHAAGESPELDRKEMKLSTYWSTSFKELCVGMKVGNDLKLISIDYPASSLYDLIADGVYRETNVGRHKWKSLIGGSSLQRNCIREGYNVERSYVGYINFELAKVRIGIIANQENDRHSLNSFVGFGGEAATLHSYSYNFCMASSPVATLQFASLITVSR